MNASRLLEQLASARQQLDQAGSLLCRPSPQGLEECSTVLEAAGWQMSQWQDELAGQAGNPEALEEAWRVRRSFQRTSRLLQAAADFHVNWMRERGAITGGYTGTGASAPTQYGSRIYLEG